MNTSKKITTFEETYPAYSFAPLVGAALALASVVREHTDRGANQPGAQRGSGGATKGDNLALPA